MIKLTWYGTFTIKLETNKQKVLFDPFIRYDKRNDQNFNNNFYNIKNIFITHGHLDHTMDLLSLYSGHNVLIHTTKTVYERLIKDGLSINKLYKINYDDEYILDDINIKVIHGKHIKFDIKLILKTIFNKNIIIYHKNLIPLIKAHIKCKEKRETVNYLLTIENKKIFLMGSMALNKKTKYPKNVDYLVLAYQGRSDLDKKIDDIINTINPKCIILSHFDNSFPPISSEVNINSLNEKLNKKIRLIITKYEKEVILK